MQDSGKKLLAFHLILETRDIAATNQAKSKMEFAL